MWDVPGGFCDGAEHPILTAEREVFEETGIRIRVVGLLGMWLDEYVDECGGAKRTLNIFYHADVSSMTVSLDRDEISEARFFPADQLPADLAFPRHVPLALQAWSRAVASGSIATPLPDRPPLE